MVTTRQCDVLVVGGGPAGIAAALGAARCGADVVLLERYGFAGGLATAGLASTICGLYLSGPGQEDLFTPDPFPAEWACRLAEMSNTETVRLEGGLRFLPFDRWDFALLADAMIGETSGLSAVFHATATGVTMEGDTLTELRALARNRTVAFRPASVVDCTGEATVVFMAGGNVRDISASQHAGAVFAMTGVAECVTDPAESLGVMRDIAAAVRDGKLPPDAANTSILPIPVRRGRVVLKVGLADKSVEPLARLTDLEMRWRNVVEKLVKFLVAEVSPFKEASLACWPTEVGIRAARRVDGLATLRADDVLSARKFADGVACGAWPIELWDRPHKPTWKHLPDGEYYEIPAGCLRTAHPENVFVAGRCISATEEALASARVIATSLATGWASGILAAHRASGSDVATAVACCRQQRRYQRP